MVVAAFKAKMPRRSIRVNNNKNKVQINYNLNNSSIKHVRMRERSIIKTNMKKKRERM